MWLAIAGSRVKKNTVFISRVQVRDLLRKTESEIAKCYVE